MSLSRRLSAFATSSDGRGRLATLASILVLASLLVLVLAVLPAIAGNGGPSGAGAVPVEIAYGGGSGACDASFPGRLPSDASYELHINNPTSRTYSGPDGTKVTLTVDPGDKYFDFEFEDSAMAALDVVVNGGSKNTHFDYDGNEGPGPIGADTALHAPTKGGSDNLYQLSHINICYDRIPLTDLDVDKEVVGSATPDEGGTVTFRLTVTNLDNEDTNATATGVVVTDNLPSAMTIVPDSVNTSGEPPNPTEGTFNLASNTWTGLTLEPGESQTLQFEVTISSNAGGQELNNTASVTGDQTDPNPDNDNADSEPPVTVNSSLSGTVFVDNNANSEYDSGDDADDVLMITVYHPNGTTYTTTSDEQTGEYELTVPPTTSEEATVCLQGRSGFEQTVPDLPSEAGDPVVVGVDCTGFEISHEPAGYSVDLSESSSGNDFGNLPILLCNIPLSESGINISATFEIFTNFNYTCGEKGVVLFVDATDTVGFLLDGSGSAAARGEITKTNAGPEFAALQYAQSDTDSFETLPWCDVRPKMVGDGDQFDEDLGFVEGTGTQYPDLLGVTDPVSGDPSISCKVTESEDILGNQTTVVFGEFLDPYFR